MSVEDALWATEREFWKADPTFHEAHYAEDALFLVGGRIQDPEEGVRGVAEAPALIDLQITDPHTRRLSPDVVALTYRAVARREELDAPYAVLVGSVYAHRNGVWKQVLHQHTPASDGPG